MSEPQEEYQVLDSPLMTGQDLLFAQIRGVLLHLETCLDWGDENFFVGYRSGEHALEVFDNYAQECGYTGLVQELGRVFNADAEFITYWNSFNEEDRPSDSYDEEPDFLTPGNCLMNEYDDYNAAEAAFESMGNPYE